jgi:hypothetical protein
MTASSQFEFMHTYMHTYVIFSINCNCILMCKASTTTKLDLTSPAQKAFYRCGCNFAYAHLYRTIDLYFVQLIYTLRHARVLTVSCCYANYSCQVHIHSKNRILHSNSLRKSYFLAAQAAAGYCHDTRTHRLLSSDHVDGNYLAINQLNQSCDKKFLLRWAI